MRYDYRVVGIRIPNILFQNDILNNVDKLVASSYYEPFHIIFDTMENVGLIYECFINPMYLRDAW